MAPAGGDGEAETSHAGGATGTAVASKGCADWWLGAIDLLVRTSPSQGDSVADHIKEQLMERDRWLSPDSCPYCIAMTAKQLFPSELVVQVWGNASLDTRWNEMWKHSELMFFGEQAKPVDQGGKPLQPFGFGYFRLFQQQTTRLFKCWRIHTP